jgi:hypothetical protein
MSYQPSVIEQVQLDMGARLMAHPFFANVPVFVLRPRFDENGNPTSAVMIQQSIDKALAGGGVAPQNGISGAAIMVDLPSGEVPHEDAPGPDLRLGYSLRVFENPLINMGASGTQISAEDLMLAAINLCHQWTIRRIGAAMVSAKRPFEPNKDFLAKNIVVYDCYFVLRMEIKGPKKVPMPVLSGNASDGVTITPPPGATVWYTFDGSYPWSGNPNAKSLDGLIGTEAGGSLEAEDGADLQTEIPSSFTIAVPPGSSFIQAVAYNTNLASQASDLAWLNLS